jgi:hypothetical protein
VTKEVSRVSMLSKNRNRSKKRTFLVTCFSLNNIQGIEDSGREETNREKEDIDRDNKKGTIKIEGEKKKY